MKNLLRAAAALLAVSFLSGCAANESKNAAPAPLLNSICIVSGESLNAESPTSDYMNGKVGFCCTKCKAKFDGLDDAGKKTMFDAKAKK